MLGLRFILVCAAVTTAIACGSSSNSNNFATYQDCYNEHTTNEGFGPMCATEICCIDHGIGSAKPNTVCGDTTQSCEAYVNANLKDATSDSGLSSDITMSCTFYMFDSGRSTTGSSSNCGS